MPSRSAYNARKRRNHTAAGPVTTYRVCPCTTAAEATDTCPDCNGAGRIPTDFAPAYEPARADRIIENGKRAPQVYDEAPGTTHNKLVGRATRIDHGKHRT